MTPLKTKILGKSPFTRRDYVLYYRVNPSGTIYARIVAGCHTFTLKKARAHWSRSPYMWNAAAAYGVVRFSYMTLKEYETRNRKNHFALVMVRKAEYFVEQLKARQ